MPQVYEFRGNQRSRDPHSQSHQKHEFTFRYARPPTSDRPLLRGRRDTTPDLLVSESVGNEKPALKFASLEDLSDSDEAEMDLSSDDAGSGLPPRKKRALDNELPVPPAPKWSNPDPYTVLPPPDESQSKKVDVVKLIRKARIAANAARPAEANAVTTNEDFISFGFKLDEKAEGSAPENAPKGPSRDFEGLPTGLSGRKRTHDDVIKGYSRKGGKPLGTFNVDGSIIDEWRPTSPETASPWLKLMEPSLHLGTRLHNEILSFYHWVKPQPFEQIVRADLVSRLQSAFERRYYGVELRPFGSFASGLYLPVADIDLVLLSKNFMQRGIKSFGERKGQIYAFSAFVKNLGIAVPGSVETIPNARVPILKFVDKLTGLRVDLSFDSDSGVAANGTFEQWKREFPAMPVIVSVIKQFLLLRGLNEVPSGGIGGFSITCLVTSLLQHLPHGQTEPNLGSILLDFFDFYGNRFDYETVGISMDPPGYFNKRVYKLHRDKDARLSIEDPNNPDNDISGGTREIALIFSGFSWAYHTLKARMISTAMSGNNRASLLEAIIAGNYEEYYNQRQRLRDVYETDPRFAPNHEPVQRPPSPPPPPLLPEEVPPPPPAPDTVIPLSPRSASDTAIPLSPQPALDPVNPISRPAPETVVPISPRLASLLEPKLKLTKSQRKQQAALDRAERLKRLRPDIESIPDSITNEQALLLGGYNNQSEMDKDLAAKEAKLEERSRNQRFLSR